MIITDTMRRDSPLHVACYENNIEAVNELLTNGANVNDQTTTGCSPLYIASLKGHKEIVNILLERGANVNSKATPTGRSPLYAAAECGHTEIAKILLARDADVNAQTTDGRSPLYAAAEYGRTEVVNELLANGANVNAQTPTGRSPLHIASRNGHKDIVNILLERDVNVNTQTTTGGFFPLYAAAEYGHAEVVNILLKRGANVNAQTTGGYSPLYIAASKGHTEIVKHLYMHGAKIEEDEVVRAVGLPSCNQEQKTNILALKDKAKAIHDFIMSGGNKTEFDEFETAIVIDITIAKGLCRRLGYVPDHLKRLDSEAIKSIIEESDKNLAQIMDIICATSTVYGDVLPPPDVAGFEIAPAREKKYSNRDQLIRSDIAKLDEMQIFNHITSSTDSARLIKSMALDKKILWPEPVFKCVIEKIRHNLPPFSDIVESALIEENKTLRLELEVTKQRTTTLEEQVSKLMEITQAQAAANIIPDESRKRPTTDTPSTNTEPTVKRPTVRSANDIEHF